MNIKVSVIFAIHNDELNLSLALDSIRNQTLKEIEVIMVDANSTDETGAIMKSYCTDKRFFYIKTQTEGISVARNLAMEKACGKYIAFGDANVIFSDNILEDMYLSAEKDNADLCISPMASSDVYGKHEFKSTDLLLRRKRISKFDTDLIWNPSVTNKLFLREKIEKDHISFNAFAKAREAAFTLEYAFESDMIVCSSKGVASYIIPVYDHGISDFMIEHYLDAYKFIIEKAEIAFSEEMKKSETEFDKKELEKDKICYIDQVYLKEITVLLYSYYRHFWSFGDEEIGKYTKILNGLFENLSKTGMNALLKKNKDIFYNGKLIDNRAEMAKRPKVTVCIGKSEKKGHLHEKRLEIQVSSIFKQTMPCFELFVDERLRDIFPKEYINFENVKFLEATSLAEFKQNALENCKTEYIMYQDGFARLNPKILMRHYCALCEREKYGFTTSPLTCFDGKKTKEYSFSDLSFYSNMSQTRVTESDHMFVLDLFFCNKLFRTEHLNGIHFVFSDSPIHDMYKLYEHSRFKKLSHRGAYLPYSEVEALSFLKSEQDRMPSDCKVIYKKYKSIFFRKIKMKKSKDAFILLLKKVKKKLVSIAGRELTKYYSRKKIQDRVFFYSIRHDGALLENLKCVYDGCNENKVVFANMLPHSLKEVATAKKYLMTSKVIVTDDYLKYLRNIRLRPEQKVIQIWHAGGAFKRFGLDAPSRLTRIEEYKTHSQYSAVSVTSEYVRQFYAHAFGIDIGIVQPLGSPRTDMIVDSQYRKTKKAEVIARHPLLKDKKVYLYLPTFREDDGVVKKFEPKIDWEKLNDELDDDEVFIVSRHPIMKEEFFGGSFFSRVKDYTFEPTPELLSVADVVVTDYSSIIFDASLFEIPMVFYCPDFDSYERDFYLDYEHDLPGEIIFDSEKLLDSLRKAFSDTDKSAIEAFRKKEMGACDGKSTQRIEKLICEYLKN